MSSYCVSGVYKKHMTDTSRELTCLPIMFCSVESGGPLFLFEIYFYLVLLNSMYLIRSTSCHRHGYWDDRSPSGEGHWDLSRLLHAEMHGTEALVYSNNSCLAIISGQIASSIPGLPVQCHYSACTDVGLGSLETTGNRVFDIMSPMWDDGAIVTLGTI